MAEAIKICFSYRNNGVTERCNALNELYCKRGKGCRFFKTKDELCTECGKRNICDQNKLNECEAVK